MYDKIINTNQPAAGAENVSVSENRYRMLFETARDGLIILDSFSRKIIDVNPSMMALSGCARNEILGKELHEIGLLSNEVQRDTAYRRLSEAGYVRFEDLLVENKAGEFLTVEFTAGTYWEDGRRLVQCTVRDNTELRRADAMRAGKTALLERIASRVARLGGWTITLPDRTLIWSDENCAIHDAPPGYKPTLEEGISYFPEEYRAQVIRYVEECATNGTPYDFELPKYTLKGRLIWVRSIGEAVRDADGNIVALQGAFQDITDRKKVEQTLRESQEQYKQMVEHASDIIYKTDARGRFTFVNPAIINILKYSKEELLNLTYLDVVHPDHRREIKRFYTRQLIKKIPDTYHELIARAKDGTEVWLGQHAQLLYKGDLVIGFQAVCRDITEKKQTEEELRHLSLTDELTGLYNLRGFTALAEHQFKLAAQKKIEKKLLLIYIDMDGLKQINDTFGHDAGSRAIIETAGVLKQSCRQSDLIARLGGDEFVVLAIEAEEENTEMILARIQRNFKDFNSRSDLPYELSVSFGVARFGSGAKSKIDDLIKQADREMYIQKRAKKRAASKLTQPENQ